MRFTIKKTCRDYDCSITEAKNIIKELLKKCLKKKRAKK